jgi:hypothetical protein
MIVVEPFEQVNSERLKESGRERERDAFFNSNDKQIDQNELDFVVWYLVFEQKPFGMS